ncbi:MAG TPA: DUF5063 domain-containing protein [Dehalococcoidia bacterium]|nr:DUF5063 domain-containing protein [Dehalococcoidia bacterium]
MSATRQHFVETEGIRSFIAAVERFCDVVDRLGTLSRVEFLRQMDELLPLVYSTASALPSYPWNDGEDENEELQPNRDVKGHLARWKPLNEAIENKLGGLEHYWNVFDPVHPTEHDAIDGTLADDIASVYLDLKDPLELYRIGTDAVVRQAIWDWGFGWKIHWGRHAVSALSAIYALVHTHYDEDDEVFDI